WNSWNAYGCNINEQKILSAAQDIVSLGLKDAGYEYVNIDDCWATMSRDPSTGRIVPDPTKFPSGIDGLAEQIHTMGLKMGIYSDAGTATCAGFPGSLGNETIDAQTFADWGIDCITDNCNVPANWTDSGVRAIHRCWKIMRVNLPDRRYHRTTIISNYSNTGIRYRRMAGALASVSRPILFSLCEWGIDNVWDWGGRVGHSWRMSGDATPAWSYITEIIALNVQHLDSIQFFAHNDMDMMEVGNGNLTIEEQRTHFAAWAFLKSPILLGTDLSQLSADQVAIISNKELLAFSQDASVAEPARPFTSDTSSPPQFFSGNSSAGTHVFIINTGSSTQTMSFNFADVEGLEGGQSYLVHDMWSGEDIGEFSGSFSTSVASHDTAALSIIGHTHVRKDFIGHSH
ncbi:glycoside hydrolase, partial [Fomitiporia mediterranea MF3/22]|uniref:glycoside hydrolase n=1 Tax=Fomitiporia mediterranea (strain MF3/22) TaxID=694068 RepID=UPI00044087FB